MNSQVFRTLAQHQMSCVETCYLYLLGGFFWSTQQLWVFIEVELGGILWNSVTRASNDIVVSSKWVNFFGELSLKLFN